MDLYERSSLLDNEEDEEDKEEVEDKDTDSHSDDQPSEGEEDEDGGGDEERERDKRAVEGRTTIRGIGSAYQRGDEDRGRMSYAKDPSPYSSYSYGDPHPQQRESRAVISRNQRIDEDYNIEEAVDLSTSFLR